MSIKIGFTERGDAGRDLSWYDKCLAGKCDGAIVITKSLTPECRERLLSLHKAGFPVVLHCGCTGWGETTVEPGAPSPTKQLDALQALMHSGFPAENVVLRVDPIIPTPDGLRRATRVLDGAAKRGWLNSPFRVRISIIDEYKHVKERFAKHNIKTAYGPTDFGPSNAQLCSVVDILWPYHEQYGLVFETCAEEQLTKISHAIGRGELFKRCGCVSETDLNIMRLIYDRPFVNPQNRSGCLCLGCKVELLENKRRCPNGCLYCYWRDKN